MESTKVPYYLPGIFLLETLKKDDEQRA
jgi:hypothetical protein